MRLAERDGTSLLAAAARRARAVNRPKAMFSLTLFFIYGLLLAGALDVIFLNR